jgi:hypothetical protein
LKTTVYNDCQSPGYGFNPEDHVKQCLRLEYQGASVAPAAKYGDHKRFGDSFERLVSIMKKLFERD